MSVCQATFADFVVFNAYDDFCHDGDNLHAVPDFMKSVYIISVS